MNGAVIAEPVSAEPASPSMTEGEMFALNALLGQEVDLLLASMRGIAGYLESSGTHSEGLCDFDNFQKGHTLAQKETLER